MTNAFSTLGLSAGSVRISCWIKPLVNVSKNQPPDDYFTESIQDFSYRATSEQFDYLCKTFTL